MLRELEGIPEYAKDIRRLGQEVEVYTSQGLFAEAKEKCEEIVQLIRQIDRPQDRQALMMDVSKRIEEVERQALEYEKAGSNLDIWKMGPDGLRKLFSLPRGEGIDSAAIERAVALLVFAHFQKAIDEFQQLMAKDTLRVFAAKNILRCYFGLCDFDSAIGQYQEWLSSGHFSPVQLERIYAFLLNILDKKGIKKDLPRPHGTPASGTHVTQEEEFVDIVSVGIPQNTESREDRLIKLDVGFQRGKVISVIIPGSNKALLERLEAGSRWEDVQFYSSAVTFRDSCMISAKKQIISGPRKGDYILVIKILDA